MAANTSSRNRTKAIIQRFLSFYEYFAVGVFSMTMMASLISGSVVKGLASGAIGFLIAMVGAAPIDGLPRLTFGFHALDGGFDILPLLIGMFAISEIIKAAKERNVPKMTVTQNFKIKGFGFSVREFISQIGNFFRSAVIGTCIGILPGIGGGTSNILAYTAAKNSSKTPEKFGTGIIDGIVASESANNATVGGALVPLLCLGIPGDAATALLLGGLTIHGLNPGPLLFDTEAELVYGIFAICLVANLLMLIAEYGGIKIFARVLTVPKYILMPIIEDARTHGIGVAGVTNSNHFGAAALYSQLAVKQGMVGIAMTNVMPLIAAPGAKAPVVGNNPFSIAIPTYCDFPFSLDMSMSVVAGGKLHLAVAKGEKIPYGWGVDKDGKPTDNPQKALEGFLLPIGGYKGLGLAYAVDILSGVITGVLQIKVKP